jgi:hypothetical protein
LRGAAAEPPLDIFLPVYRQVEGRDEGQANLAAVGVTGEHEVDVIASDIGQDIRLVGE